MDTWALLILAVGILGYFINKRNKEWLFVIGFGAGLLTGAFWAAKLINDAFANFLR